MIKKEKETWWPLDEAENGRQILVSCSWLWGKGAGKRAASAGRTSSQPLHAS